MGCNRRFKLQCFEEVEEKKKEEEAAAGIEEILLKTVIRFFFLFVSVTVFFSHRSEEVGLIVCLG